MLARYEESTADFGRQAALQNDGATVAGRQQPSEGESGPERERGENDLEHSLLVAQTVLAQECERHVAELEDLERTFSKALEEERGRAEAERQVGAGVDISRSCEERAKVERQVGGGGDDGASRQFVESVIVQYRTASEAEVLSKFHETRRSLANNALVTRASSQTTPRAAHLLHPFGRMFSSNYPTILIANPHRPNV